MRMRRKKHLEERFEALSNLLIRTNFLNKTLEEGLNSCSLVDYKHIFGNSNPVELEIGCGKGQFISELAKAHPEVNFIAVEKSQNVIVEAMEKIHENNITNVRFINSSAVFLPALLRKQSIQKLYLNFSCPFPKNRDAKHRLTHKNYLEIYKNILVSPASIIMKTDNSNFFEFTLNSFSDFGFTLKNITFDLHNSKIDGNIMTEYEQKFSNEGLKIFRTEAYFFTK